MSKFLKEHVKNIENDLKNFISEFFKQIREDENINSSNATDKNKNSDLDLKEILKYFRENLGNLKTNFQNYITKEEIEKFYTNFISKDFLNEEKINLDFSNYIDLLRILYFTTINKNSQNFHFENSFINTLTQELKIFHNFFLSQPNSINDELLQRFFENIYFLFKNLKFPKFQKNIFSDYLLKDLNIVNKTLLTLNSQKENSFTLDYNILNNLDQEQRESKNDNILLDSREKNFISNQQESNYISPMVLDKEKLKNIFNKNEKEKLFDFRIDLLNGDGIIEISKREVKIKEERNLVVSNRKNEKIIKNEISYKNLMENSINGIENELKSVNFESKYNYEFSYDI
jgi:hypothetical protein